jgi:putative membrane-bound dehydrogenase-like protein
MNLSKHLTLGILAAACYGYGTLEGWQTRAWPPPVQKVSASSPTLSPDDELKTFHLAPGYRAELVASEPMVVDPIAIDFDLEGRMWVIEMLGFMPDTSGTDSRGPLGRIAVLEDENDDGTMDKRTVFLDKLILPRALKILDRGVLIGEPPNLWLARDTNGDLVADAKDLVRNDYGRLEGNPEHNANSLYWALDNTIYTSEHTYHLKLRDGKPSGAEGDRVPTFEAMPTLSRGQWGVGADDAGRIYRNWNEQPLFVDYVAPHYYTRNPNLARTSGLYEILMDPKDMTVWPVRPTRGVNRGYREGTLRSDGTLTTYVSAGTPTIYRGDRLPKDLYGDAFITESAGNLVHRLKIVDDGTGRLTGRNAYPKGEFFASTDERFRPVNLFGAPDGTLYVVDMYRGVIQDGQYWTDYLRDYIKKNQLELPVNLGRIWRVVHETTKRDRKPSLTRATPQDLVKLFSHPNGWYRDTAQRLLVERGEKSVAPALKQLATTFADYRGKLHALWTLDGIGEIDAATVQTALADKSAAVRASAVRLAERWLAEANHPLQAAIITLTDDPTWTVRYQVAASLGALPKDARVAPLIAFLQKHEGDKIAVDAAISSLAGLEAQVLEQLLMQPTPNTKGVISHSPNDHVMMLAAAIARGRDAAAVSAMLARATEGKGQDSLRQQMLEGIVLGLEGGGGRGGGGGGGGRGGGRGGAGTALALPAEPVNLTSLNDPKNGMTPVARRVLARLTWPGKPTPVVEVTPLTAAEQKRFEQGREIYTNLCVACHQPDGQGREKIAPSLVNSRYVQADPGVATRIVLAGKEGPVGLMPPLGASLSDEQIASVLTYIRREWGHTASAVAPADVKEIRGLTASRNRPWTEDEIGRLVGGRGGRGGRGGH